MTRKSGLCFKIIREINPKKAANITCILKKKAFIARNMPNLSEKTTSLTLRTIPLEIRTFTLPKMKTPNLKR
jgi:hypothetical protein